jgi:uncharacterized iron-regulated protein
MAKGLYEKVGDRLVIGAEMFERDDQLKINEYLKGRMSASNFENEAKIWDNYKTDYKPVLEFAKENHINFIATNIPRRYASMVAKSGFPALNDLDVKAKAYLPKLPIDFNPNLPSYQKMKKELGGAMHGSAYIVEAQAIKDATMAESILDNYKKGDVFLHLNGAYHSNNFEGIYWYLMRMNPNLKVVTISVEKQDDLKKLSDEFKNLADYIIIVPSSMTRTY